MTNRSKTTDIIKAFSIFLVILNHTNIFNKTSIPFLLVINCAVPCFVLLSGYVFAIGNWEKTPSECYAVPVVYKKIKRLTFPMIPAVLAYTAYQRAVRRISVRIIVRNLLVQSYGAGSYYYAIMLLFVLLLPIVKESVRKHHEKALAFYTFVCVAWELVCKGFAVTPEIYRIIGVRYLFTLATGVYLYYVINKTQKVIPYTLLAASSIIGGTYLLIPHFGGWYRLFSYPVWGRTSMVVTFWVAPVLYLLLRREIAGKTYSLKFGGGIQQIGKASYHIMYSQMMFFTVYYDYGNGWMQRDILSVLAGIILAEGLSMILGMLWYRCENNWIIRKTGAA